MDSLFSSTNGQFSLNGTQHNVYAILSDSSDRISPKVDPKKETLLDRIQRGVGFEIDSSGLSHYYLSSIRLSPGKGKKNVIKKDVKTAAVKKRFFL